MDVSQLAAGRPKPPGGPTASPPLERQADPPPAPATADGQDDPADAIRAFVTRHHGKVGLGDLDGFVADYAWAVDLNDKGQVDPEFIRRDQAAYLPKYDRLSETIAGPIEVEPNGTGWRARYAIRSFAVGRRDGKEHDRRVGITLDIRRDGFGAYRIHRERAGAAN